MNNPDRIEMMRTFVRIIESGSISAAAVQMATTQPTVSRRLAQLEKMLGTKLILRTTHKMKLTDDGERCYAHARILLGNWDALEAQLSGTEDEPVGLIRVRAPHAFGQEQLIPHVVDLLQRYPQLNIDWVLNDKSPNFIADNIDCAVHVGAVDDPSCVAVLLAEVPRVLVASPHLFDRYPKPLAVEDLAQLPWAVLSTFNQREALLRNNNEQRVHQFPLQARFSTDSLYAVYNAALAGLGVAIVSRWVAVEALEQGHLLQVLPEWQADSLPVYLTYPYANYYPVRLRKFFNLMKEVMPNLVGTTKPT